MSPWPTRRSFLWRAGLILAALLHLFAAPLLAGEVRLLSRADPDLLPYSPQGSAGTLAVSGDGRWIVFSDNAPNLLAGQGGPAGVMQLFLYDTSSSTTILVSRAAGSTLTGGNDDSGILLPAISDDGRYVYFVSLATDLVAGQTDSPETYDLFLFDRLTGGMSLVSHAAGEPTAARHVVFNINGTVFPSGDGRYAVFLSEAQDVVAGQADANGSRDVFLYDRVTGTSRLVSHRPGSEIEAAAGSSDWPVVSVDGRWVAFASDADDLVSGRTDGVFLFDRTSGLVTWVGPGTLPAVSADGGWIAFISQAADVIPGQLDTNGSSDLFLVERSTGAMTLVSHTPTSPVQAGNAGSGTRLLPAAFSADGRWLAFSSDATNLVSGQDDRNGNQEDVFLFDRTTGGLTLVSGAAASPSMQTGDGFSADPRLSPDGRYLVFSSGARDLVPGQIDSNNFTDVFLFDRLGGKTLMSHASTSAVTAGAGLSSIARLSADGLWVAYLSRAADLANGTSDSNSRDDIYLFSRAAGTNTLISRRVADAGAGGSSIAGPPSSALNADGRWMAFVSTASTVGAGAEDTNAFQDVFLFDRLTEEIRLVSHEAGALRSAAGEARDPLVSADGSTIVFTGTATNLVPGQITTTNLTQLFQYDRAGGTNRLISHASHSAVTTADFLSGPGGYSISFEGRWTAYTSSSTNLVAGQSEGNSLQGDIFLFDRVSGTNRLVSHTLASPTQTGNGTSHDPSLSADGGWLAFSSEATDLVPGHAGGVFLFDRSTDAITWVGSGTRPEISFDGRWIAFLSAETGVVPGQVDTNGGTDVFLWDRLTGETLLVSRSAGAPEAAGNGESFFNLLSENPNVLSADGRYLVYMSRSTDLVSGQVDANGAADVFLFDRASGTTTLVSRSSTGPLVAADQESTDPGISADGGRIVFPSRSTNLVAGQIDTNGTVDLFLYQRADEAMEIVSHRRGSPATTGNGGSLGVPRINADGTVVAFTSDAGDLVDGDLGTDRDAFFHASPPGAADFFTLPPCRLFDTRRPEDGPALVSGVPVILEIDGGCAIPATARVLALNITVVAPTGPGYLTLYPGDTGPPTASAVTFTAGQVRSNNTVISLALNGNGTLALRASVAANGTVHAALDVVGYFE